jgi:hypothetical protein
MKLGIIVSIYQVWGEIPMQFYPQTSPVAGFFIDRDIIFKIGDFADISFLVKDLHLPFAGLLSLAGEGGDEVDGCVLATERSPLRIQHHPPRPAELSTPQEGNLAQSSSVTYGDTSPKGGQSSISPLSSVYQNKKTG